MEQFILGNTGLDPLIRTANDRVIGRFGHLNKLVNAITALQQVPPGSGITSVQPGNYIEIDDSDAANPIINNIGVHTVTGTAVDNTDDKNPIINIDVDSGTWTPTFSGDDNACSNSSVVKAFYSRVGNIVICTIYGTVDLDFFSFPEGTIQTTFPIASATPNPIGSVSIQSEKQFNGYKNSTTRLVFQSADTSFVDTDVPFYAVFQYEIN